MNDDANDGSPPDFTDSDRAWYAALSGQTPPGEADTTAAREGVALRLALEMRSLEIEDRVAATAAESPDATQRQLELLQQRVAREGIFDRTRDAAAPPPVADRPKVIEFPWWRRHRTVLALAASVLVAVAVVPQFLGGADYPLPGQMMGGPEGVQAARAPQPRQAAERLADQLRQAGLRPGLYQRGKTYVVDITLMSTDLPAAAPAFSRLGLAPTTGFNRVEISPP